jgi:hypothetical protein
VNPRMSRTQISQKKHVSTQVYSKIEGLWH